MLLVAHTGILSFKLDENNVQLILLRALSGLWDLVSLDEMKQVNLRLPDESVQHTYIGYVPYPLASLPADEACRVLTACRSKRSSLLAASRT